MEAVTRGDYKSLREFIDRLAEIAHKKSKQLDSEALVGAMFEPEASYIADPWEDGAREPYEDDLRQRMVWGNYIKAVAGDSHAIESLISLLLTEPLNRKLDIAFFLGVLTDGFVGSRYKSLPTRSEVISWARRWVTERGNEKLPHFLSTLKFYPPAHPRF